MSRVLLLVACLSVAGVSIADGGAPPMTTVLSGHLTDYNPFLDGRGRNRFPVTVYMRGDALRVDFQGRPGERGRMLLDGSTGMGWLVDLGGGRAVQIETKALNSLVALAVDPDKPCARFVRRCETTLARQIAGQSRKGYRFRGASGRGPAGLSDGEFWVDAEHGVIVAYRGTGIRGRDAPAFEASLVTHDVLDEEFFTLPDVEIPQPPDRRSWK